MVNIVKKGLNYELFDRIDNSLTISSHPYQLSRKEPIQLM